MSQNEFTGNAGEWDKHPVRRRVADDFAAEVERLINFTPQSEVLDFGCGTGLVGLRFGSKVKTLHMLDTSEAMLAMLKGKIADADSDYDNVQIISVPLERARLPEGKLDAIFTSLAFHHVDNLPEVLESMCDALKQEGQLVIGELLPEDGSFHGDTMVPYHGFSPEQLGGLLESAGFSVNQYYDHGAVNKPGKDGVLKEYGKFVVEARRR